MEAEGERRPLVHPSQTAAVMRRFGWRFIRDLGQNFLIDANVLRKIVDAAALRPDDIVLEVGTGIGTLTEALAAKAAYVVSVEIDRRLLPILAETLAGLDNVKILPQDAMAVTADQLEIDGGRPAKMVANLPYNIAAPVILKYFAGLPSIKSMVVMVQREIAERIMAEPGTKDYSAFTVKLRYFAGAQWLQAVSRRVFVPPPKVDSAIIKLTRWEKAPVEVGPERLFAVVTAGFSQRRKMLVNALATSALGVTKDRAAAALEAAGVPPNARAEELSLAEFASLANYFGDILFRGHNT